MRQLETKPTVPVTKLPERPQIEQGKNPQIDTSGNEKIRFMVRQFKIEGATLIEENRIRAITQPHEGTQLSLSQLHHIAREITAAYQQQGYLLAYALIPAQEIHDGIVMIKVLESAVDNIIVSGNKHYSREFIKQHIEVAVRANPSLKADALERAILILNDYPSLHVRTYLKAGEKPDTSAIVVKARDTEHLHGSASYDNFGSTSTSRQRLNLSLEKGHLFQDGDVLTLSGITGLDRVNLNELAYGKMDYTMPIGYNGMKAGGYYAYSQYEVGENLRSLQIHGNSQTAGLYLTYPLIKQTGTTLLLKTGFDYKNIFDYLLKSSRGRAKIRSGYLGVNYDFRDRFFASNSISLTYTQGIPNFLGGTGNNDAGTGRVGAEGSFGKAVLDVSRNQPISDDTSLLIIASAQGSADSLFSAEQFGIGGVGSVRGFKPTQFSGDSGYMVNAELHVQHLIPKIPLVDQSELVLFVDHGGVFRNNLQPGEKKYDSLTSVGIGARLFASSRYSLRVDWAVPKINSHLSTDNSETYVQVSVNF